jgi:hypothetical protein
LEVKEIKEVEEVKDEEAGAERRGRESGAGKEFPRGVHVHPPGNLQ